MAVCSAGCIACHLCEKTCEHDAVHVIDNIAYIDQEKCTGCGGCAEKCPKKVIIKLKEQLFKTGACSPVFVMVSVDQPRWQL